MINLSIWQLFCTPSPHNIWGSIKWGYRKWERTRGNPVNPPKEKKSSIPDWSKAFSTFISVYIQKPGRGWRHTATHIHGRNPVHRWRWTGLVHVWRFISQRQRLHKKNFLGHCQPNPPQYDHDKTYHCCGVPLSPTPLHLRGPSKLGPPRCLWPLFS